MLIPLYYCYLFMGAEGSESIIQSIRITLSSWLSLFCLILGIKNFNNDFQ